MHPAQSQDSVVRPARHGIFVRLAPLALAACLWAQTVGAQTAPTATGFEGLWRAEDASVIELKRCPKADQLCGYIAWAKEEGTDEANPNPGLRNRPICGLLILELQQFDGKMWRSGWVYDPQDGKTYKAALRKRDGKLFLRGYVGAEVFGETETWTAAASPVPTCNP